MKMVKSEIFLQSDLVFLRLSKYLRAFASVRSAGLLGSVIDFVTDQLTININLKVFT